MLARLRRNLTFANVCSFIALFVALGTGAAYAANTVFSTDIVDGEVKTADLADAGSAGNGVTSAKITGGAVVTGKLADGAVTGAKLANGSVGAQQIATGGVAGSSIADAAVDASKLSDGAVTGAKIADGSVGSTDIAADSIDGTKVVDGSLTTADLAGADVNTARIDLKKGAVAPGRCADFNVPAAGATPGEAVLVSTQGSLAAAVMLSGVTVPSAGTVVIKVCNFNKRGKLKAITGLPVRIITFG